MKSLHHLTGRLLPCFPAFFSIFFLSANLCSAQSFPKIITRSVLATGLSQPIQVVNAGDGTNRLFIVQQGGTVKVLDRTDDNTFVDRGVFFNIGSIPNTGEEGLLSMVFDPNFTNNKRFYVFYTNTDGNLEIARYETGGDPYRADMATKHILLTIPHLVHQNHNGGEMHFGPGGFLYVSTGDGGSGGDPSNNAQNTNVFLGKLLRLDVSKADLIAANNPFANLVYAYGLRNPFRWSFDRLNDDLWLGDVGQGAYEEINSIAFSSLRGANFGWRCYEGGADYNTQGCDPSASYISPVRSYEITDTTKSVIGGVVYRGSAFPALYGYYIGADYYAKKIHMILKTETGFLFNNDSQATASGIADFGEAENGELYAVSRTANTLYRIIPDPGALPVSFVSLGTSVSENHHALVEWGAVQTPDLATYEVQRSVNGTSFSTIGTVDKKEASDGQVANYSFEDQQIRLSESYYYRIRALSVDGTFLYSAITRFSTLIKGTHQDPSAKHYILPNIIEQGKINMSLSEPFDRLELVSLSGQTVQKFELGSRTGEVVLDTGKIPPGIYLARLISPGRVLTEKIIFP